MKKAVEWARLTWDEADGAVQRQGFAVLPLGAIEEHGPHMTLDADCRAAEVFAARLAAETDCILLPTIPYGQVWSLKGFPGSLTIRTETLVALLTDLCNSLETKGFKGVVAVTGHLGNLASMKSASRELADAGRIPLLSLFYPGLDEIAAKVCVSRRAHGSIVHADEIETSLLLAMDPQCVRMEKAVSEYPEFPADFEARAVPWDSLSRTGVFGDPTMATREKGEEMLDFVTRQAARIVASFKESIGERR
jgi:creatinine amidohydrolase